MRKILRLPHGSMKGLVSAVNLYLFKVNLINVSNSRTTIKQIFFYMRRLSRVIDSLSYRLNMVMGRFQYLESLTDSNSIEWGEVKCELDNIRMYMRQAREALQEIPQSLDIELIDHEDAAVECALWLYESGAAPAEQSNMAYTPYYNHSRDTWSINLELDCFYGRKYLEFEVNYDGKILKFGEVPSREILNEFARG